MGFDSYSVEEGVRLSLMPFLFCDYKKVTFAVRQGGLAQLARALAWQARGHRFDSGILHPTGYFQFFREYPVFIFAETLISTKTQSERLIDFGGSTFLTVKFNHFRKYRTK